TEFRTKFARQLAQRVIDRFVGAEDIGEVDGLRPVERQPDLTEAARELLLEAVQDTNGVIMRLGSMMGTSVQTKGRNFVESGNTRSAARWRGAVDELQARSHIEDRAGKGEIFWVTDTGYRASELLKAEP